MYFTTRRVWNTFNALPYLALGWTSSKYILFVGWLRWELAVNVLKKQEADDA